MYEVQGPLVGRRWWSMVWKCDSMRYVLLKDGDYMLAMCALYTIAI